MQGQIIFNIILLAIIIIISISFHEFSHSLVAYLLGDSTAKDEGRLTLDPTKHITLWGLIFMILTMFRFGWGKPTPVNPNNLKNKYLYMLIISLAGPISNIILAIIFALLLKINVYGDLNNTKILYIINYFIIINISLAVFNLIPIPPLDGGNILNFIFKRSNIEAFFYKYGIYILIIMILPIIPINGYESLIQIIITPIINFVYTILIFI